MPMISTSFNFNSISLNNSCPIFILKELFSAVFQAIFPLPYVSTLILSQNVRRALQDISSRYCRTRASVIDMQAAEEQYKLQVTKMQDKLRKDLGRYEVLKSDANEKLFTANGRLEEVKKTGEAQIMKLRAMLKKEEMRIKSLEKDVEKKQIENDELTQICDQLISKVGS